MGRGTLHERVERSPGVTGECLRQESDEVRKALLAHVRIGEGGGVGKVELVPKVAHEVCQTLVRFGHQVGNLGEDERRRPGRSSLCSLPSAGAAPAGSEGKGKDT